METNNSFNHLVQQLSLLAFSAFCAFGSPTELSDPGWPRRFAEHGAELTVHQPQVDQWTDFKILQGRCAFTLRTVEGQPPVYGTLRFEGHTIVDVDRRIVLLRNVRKFDLRFPASPGGVSRELADLAGHLMPSDAVVLSLDRLLASVRAAEVPTVEAKVLTDPPPIYVSAQPAILVIVDGAPVLANVDNSSLRRVVNTNWPLYQDPASHAFYLLHDEVWLKAADLHGAYTFPATVPADLPRHAAPKPGVAPPKVIVVDRPAELIVTEGPPQLAPIGVTALASVINTGSDLFFESTSASYFYLTSGRWFKAATLQGPWTYASSNLPSAFRRIPADHPRAHVLAAVPGTREAEDAVLLATIPRTAEVNRAQAKAEVQYAGTPDFTPIAGTSVSYARNTPNDVLKVGDLYYLCLQGVWFVSPQATGPWQTADRVPPEIYTIPESSPKYNVTYVRVYASTPSTIVVGYTAGYSGAYVSHGVVVWGTGYYYAPYVAIAPAVAPVYWASPCYTYGASAWYNPATGVYARGAAVYGPYGGYGAASVYNPRTGNYSAGYRASNPYGSWGEGVVTNGSDWARGGYRSGSRGAVAAGETSQGGAGVAVSGAHGNSGYLAKSGSGDIYAGANGNVYKRDNGQWYQNQNGSWNAMDKSAAEAQHQQAAARDRGSRNADLAERSRSQGHRSIEQRPQFQGRRR